MLTDITRRMIAFAGRRWRQLASPKHEAFQRILGDRFLVGAGTLVEHAELVTSDPSDCMLSIGGYSNVECRIVMERPGARLSIGSRTHVGGGTLIDIANSVSIGDDVLIAFDVLVMDHDSHSANFNERRRDVTDWIAGRKDWSRVPMAAVVIADKAWVGARAIILKGVEIGEGSIVGAGSVVTKSVPPWTAVAGNPARVIRELSSP